MTSQLDVAYNSLKTVEGTDVPVVNEATANAAAAMSELLRSVCVANAGGDNAAAAAAYEEHSPKALVLITMALDSLCELLNENSETNVLLDVVLEQANEETN